MTSSATNSVIVSSWPDHLVPACMDGRIHKPFSHVIDIAHLVDYCSLHYFPMPTTIAAPPQQMQAPVQPAPSFVGDRRTSLAAAAARKKSVAFSTDGNMNDSPSSPTGRRLSAAVSRDRFEVQLMPTGAILLVGAALHLPATGARNEGALADEERFHSIRIPNQHVFLKPINAQQATRMVSLLQKWIRVANQQMFNSRMMIVRAEFAAIPLSSSTKGSNPSVNEALSPTAADNTSHQDDAAARMLIQAQHAQKEDFEFCKFLNTAVFALGNYANARDATSEKEGNADVAQRVVNLASASSSAVEQGNNNGAQQQQDNKIQGLKRKYVTLLVPFTFGSLDKIVASVHHEVLGWFIPAHQRSGISVMQLLANHDISKAPYSLELVPKESFLSGVGGQSSGRNNGSAKKKRNAMLMHHINTRVRVVCRLSWVSDENHVLRVNLKACRLFRKDFFLPDPVCFVSTKQIANDDGQTSSAQTGKGEEGNTTTTGNANSTSATTYKCITEAYRNKLDAEFSPLLFALPLEIPTAAASAHTVDFMSSSQPNERVGGASSDVAAKQLKSKIFPPNVLPPVQAPPPTLLDLQSEQQAIQATVSTMHRYGDDILLPYIQPNEVLNIEVVDAAFNAATRDTLPSLLGAAQVRVQDVLDRATLECDEASNTDANKKSASSSSPRGVGGTPVVVAVNPPSPTSQVVRAPLVTNLAGSVHVTASTPSSTVDRLRSRQKKRFPVPLSRFVFTSLAEATSEENSQMLNRGGAMKGNASEVVLSQIKKQNRPSFLEFFQGGQWDISSLIIADCTTSSMWSHFNSFLPNDMDGSSNPANAAGGGPSSPRRGEGGETKVLGKNVYETVIVMINRLLTPMLSRGGSDLFLIASATDGSTSLMPAHTYSEAFGVHVDETSLVDRRMNAAHAFTPLEVEEGQNVNETAAHNAMAPVSSELTGLDGELLESTEPQDEGENAGVSYQQQQSSSAASATQLFSAIRDWSGESTLPAYRSKLEMLVLKLRNSVGMTNETGEFLERALADILRNTPETGNAENDPPTRRVQTSKTTPQPPPPSRVSRQPLLLTSVLRRAMGRCAALSSARKNTLRRLQKSNVTGAAQLGSQVFHVVTILIHSEIADVQDSVTLLLSWLTRPIFFILIFLDEPASGLFCGVSNCITVDMTCCSRQQQLEQRNPADTTSQGAAEDADAGISKGRPRKSSASSQGPNTANSSHCCSLINFELPLLSVHRQIKTLETAIQRVPLGFLSFARLTGARPKPMSKVLASLSEREEARTSSPSHRTPSLANSHGAAESEDRSRSMSISMKEKEASTSIEPPGSREVKQFQSAREAFLVAFGFKKPTATPKSGSVAAGADLKAKASILGGTTVQPTSQGKGRSSSTRLIDAAGGGSDVRVTLPPDTNGEGTSKATTKGGASGENLLVLQGGNHGQLIVPSDLRTASVSIVDVYMDEEQIREWETDPQKLRSKMMTAASASKRASTPTINSSGAPLIDDSLIRLHLQQTKSSQLGGDENLEGDVGDDWDDESVVSNAPDPTSPVKVFSRRTKYDGHLKEVSVRIGGMESFVSKLPVPPSVNRRPTSTRGRRASLTGTSQDTQADGDRSADPGSPHGGPSEPIDAKPLTARQMAVKRENEEVQATVERALKKLMKKTGQHLLKPHIHNRLIQSNQTLEKQRKSITAMSVGGDETPVAGDSESRGGGDTSDTAEDEPRQAQQRGGGARSKNIMTGGASTLPQEEVPYKPYLGHSQMINQVERNLRRLESASDRWSARSSRSGTSMSNDRPSSANVAPRPPQKDLVSSRGVYSKRSTLLATQPVEEAEEGLESDAHIRFQQLPSEKKMKLQQLMSADHRSFGGPKLNEEKVFEQEAETEKRILKEMRRRETERIEEAFRQEKVREQFEKNRIKVRQMVLTSSRGPGEDIADSEMEAVVE